MYTILIRGRKINRIINWFDKVDEQGNCIECTASSRHNVGDNFIKMCTTIGAGWRFNHCEMTLLWVSRCVAESNRETERKLYNRINKTKLIKWNNGGKNGTREQNYSWFWFEGVDCVCMHRERETKKRKLNKRNLHGCFWHRMAWHDIVRQNYHGKKAQKWSETIFFRLNYYYSLYA